MNDIPRDWNRASRAYPFPGGIAGKLGDRFEAKWAVKKLFEVLLGDADALQFEFIDPTNYGVEFWTSRNGQKEWYQAKRQNSQGNWTIGRLEKEGVLTTALVKLSESDNSKFFFVSETPATELGPLARRAALVETGGDEFLNCLTEDERNGYLPALNRTWHTTTDQTWCYLRRLCVLVESEVNLDTDIRLLGAHVFSDSPDGFFPILRDYLENNYNRELTSEVIRREIIEAGVLSPSISFDPTIRERIALANQRYLASYTPFGVGGAVIPRSEAKEILELLDADDGPSIILLTGNAGTGKSGVVREVLKGFEDCGTIHMAFRVDQYLGTDSSQTLGQKLYDRRENPVVTLESLTPAGTAILLIDQIDAISEVSGRAGPIRDVIFELIRFVKASRKVRLIAACRSYDLSNDRALLELEKEHRVRRIEIKLLDWTSEVEPLLRDKEIQIERISPKQRELLNLPLNLALFLDVAESGERNLQFQSTADLFARLVEKKQRTIRERGYPGFTLMAALSELAAFMSRDQSLDAPASALDKFPDALDLLATEGLVTYLNGRVNFFHESLFDYAFARGFVTERRSLLALLKADEQHLFRRTQVRQILAMYRQVGPLRLYLEQLRDLLTSPAVRYHLKDAVARWLGSLHEPSEAELDVILILDIPNQRMPALVRLALYPQPDWLPLLLRRGLIQEWLASENAERRDDALSILRNATKTFSVEVAQSLRSWWQGDLSRGTTLLGWFSWLHDMQPCRELLELNLDLIRSKPDGLFERAGLYDRHSLSAWVKNDPEAAGELLRVWFETWYETFPEGHPFERDHHNDLEYHWLEELQKRSPAAFINAAMPAFVEAIRRINLSFDGQSWTDYTWQYRYDREHYGAGRFLALLLRSLRELAGSAPALVLARLNGIDPLSHPAVLYLWLEIIGGSGETFGDLLPSLLAAEKLFEAGPNGAEWLSFARAANSAFPHLSREEKLCVEARILSHWPELSRAKRISHELANGQPEEEPFETRKSAVNSLNWNGYKQWCILGTLDKTLFSSIARQRLAQLDRKFIGKALEKPNDFEATTVPPPIDTDRARRMSDSDWLNAIDTYREGREMRRINRERRWHTGSRGLAEILRGQTKEEPGRFTRLLFSLPSDTSPVYFNGILNGLEEGQSSKETLESAIRFAHGLPGRPCCEGICRLLQKHPTLAGNDEVFAILLWYVENGSADTDDQSDPKRAQELLVPASQLIEKGGFMLVRGGYYDRGLAVEALGTVLWECLSRLEEGINVLRRRIEQEPLESIRCLLTHPLYSVLRHDNRSAAELLKNLVVQRTDLLPLRTYSGIRLLYYILHGASDIGNELLELLLSSENEEHRLMGAFHLFREAFYDDTLASRAEELATQSDQHRKLAADAAANHLPHAAYRGRAEHQLMVYFNDPIKEIRAEAAECFRGIWKEGLEPYRSLMRTFIQSKAFDESNFSFFHLLKEAHESKSEEVILAAERILDLAEQPDEESSPQGRLREMHYLDELLLQEYSATEDRPELRRRVLDIFDRMLVLGLYGTDKIIQEHERM